MIIMIIKITIIILMNNKGNREEKEGQRLRERAMYCYSTVTSKISNVVIFTNHIFSVYILHQAKIQHCFIGFDIRRK